MRDDTGEGIEMEREKATRWMMWPLQRLALLLQDYRSGSRQSRGVCRGPTLRDGSRGEKRGDRTEREGKGGGEGGSSNEER